MNRRGTFETALRLVKGSCSKSHAQEEENFFQAQLCSEAARWEEQNGFPFTAALKWREAAQLFGQDADRAERCWSEWERIMGLPRERAFPTLQAA